MPILYAVLSLGGMGLAFGLLLAVASKYLTVEQDERVPRIIDTLPNANCGGCGYAGCSAFAQAVVNGEISVSGCTVGGNAVAQKVAEVMGVTAADIKPKVAKVLCCGKNDVAKDRYEYDGILDCNAANLLGGGQKACTYGCLGFGNCAKECPFDAIEMKDGIAFITEKCVGCGKCVAICPKNIIKLVPQSARYVVMCSSKDKGADVKNKCSVGCIACRICEKACPTGAITVTDNLAEIDYSKCTNCGVCAQKCPQKIIINCNNIKNDI